MQPYVYIIRHNPTGKLYVGSRCVSKTIDILVRYKTSSKVVKQLLDKDPNCFSVECVMPCGTPEDALNLENTILKSIKDKSRYINVNFSAGGAVIKSQTHYKITDGTVTVYHPKNLEIPHGWWFAKMTPPVQKGKRKYIDLNTLETALYHPSEAPNNSMLWADYVAKEKSLSPKKTVWITNGVINSKISSNDIIPDGWRIGKTVRKSTKPRSPRRGKGSTRGKIAYTNGISNIYVDSNQIVPEGFVRGLTRKSCNAPMDGMQWITNGTDSKAIPKHEDIPDGYRKGRIRTW